MIILEVANIFYNTHIHDVGMMCIEGNYYPIVFTPFLYIVEEYTLFYSMLIIAIGVISSTVSIIKNVKRTKVFRILFSGVSIIYFTFIVLFHFLDIVYLNYLDNIESLIVIILSYYSMVLNILLCFDNKKG